MVRQSIHTSDLEPLAVEDGLALAQALETRQLVTPTDMALAHELGGSITSWLRAG